MSCKAQLSTSYERHSHASRDVAATAIQLQSMTACVTVPWTPVVLLPAPVTLSTVIEAAA